METKNFGKSAKTSYKYFGKHEESGWVLVSLQEPLLPRVMIDTNEVHYMDQRGYACPHSYYEVLYRSKKRLGKFTEKDMPFEKYLEQELGGGPVMKVWWRGEGWIKEEDLEEEKPKLPSILRVECCHCHTMTKARRWKNGFLDRGICNSCVDEAVKYPWHRKFYRYSLDGKSLDFFFGIRGVHYYIQEEGNEEYKKGDKLCMAKS